MAEAKNRLCASSACRVSHSLSHLPGFLRHVRHQLTQHSTQVGVASWYGEAFSGRRTASGERFDPNAMTAAHRTLLLGTKVRVINVENGRSVTVRINDRGPVDEGRIIDLSRAAADALGIRASGTAKVRLEGL